MLGIQQYFDIIQTIKSLNFMNQNTVKNIEKMYTPTTIRSLYFFTCECMTYRQESDVTFMTEKFFL